jgi:NAD(P)-dependent dehydrogenase (short-subunit alcohol dehydrogenase family)
MTFENQVAIVTGAAKGIGWGIAKVFSEKGAKVVVVDWDEANGRKTAEDLCAKGGEAIFVRCDVSNEEQVKAMIDTALPNLRRIDILVNNAGIGVYLSVTDATSADWDRCLGVNLKGVFLCSKYAIPHMQNSTKEPSSISRRSTPTPP